MMQTPVSTKPFLKNARRMEVESVNYTVSSSGQVESKRFSRTLKLFMDYALTIPGLILISPLLLAITILVKLDSPGPVIHRRRVLGRDGRVFDAFKFRTMYVNGDEILARYPRLRTELDRNYKLKCDPRVTRIGQILRKFSLDELPQLFNIVRQEMSLVGPRIITPEELEKYGSHGGTLMTVVPGLTGLWQISGRSDTSYEERVRLDMEYIHNWSVWLDVKILFLTIPAVLKGDGAY
jgi:lipopolysaccharide/colanic/teichoic acid biosynthesis glycosyltransferase